ncbi:MAG: GTP 3',8-cyclase MoaA [Anaerolineaceae bacterium]|nr:GTP 3',8-cyclase MoaA [Anaerolineaceae bacterium]
MLIDPFGRQITYLRISVTDRCNLRCVYCMPPEGIRWQPHSSIIRYEEIVEVVKEAAKQGVNEVRLTGGEPLARHGLADLVRMISAIPGIDDISLTTNGLLLEKYAGPLAEAGLKRVNISLDTLQPEKFRKITRGGQLERVWAGLEEAEANELAPIKINTVAMRGINEDELLNLARLSLDHPWNMRFIELMPVNNQQPWGEGFPLPEKAYLSIQEIEGILEPLKLEAIDGKIGNGPARQYRMKDGRGTVGFITPMGDAFCEKCNRLRLTADGNLRPCLLSDIEIPVLPALRAGDSILPYLEQAVAQKPEGHGLTKIFEPGRRCMMQIGG